MGHTPGMMSEHWPELAALVNDVVAVRVTVAAAQAEEARLFAAAVELVLARSAGQGKKRNTIQDLALREVSAELSAATRTSDRAVQRRMGDAFSLAQKFPTTLNAWSSGGIDAGHVAAILAAGIGLASDLREQFETLALDAAREESAGRLQATAKAIATRLDPEGSARRIRDAEAGRKVRVYDLGEGMSRLLADVPSVLADAIHDRLTQQARAVRAASSDLDDRPVTDAELNVDSDSNADTDSNADADDRSPISSQAPRSGPKWKPLPQVNPTASCRRPSRRTRGRWTSSVPTSSATNCSRAHRWHTAPGSKPSPDTFRSRFPPVRSRARATSPRWSRPANS